MTPADGPKRTLSRRAFVAALAAGGAALVAPGALAAGVPPARTPARARARAEAALSPADRAELARQRTSLRATLDVIRGHAMPPGTEIAAVFRPLAPGARKR